jgi:hypothetical protein
MSNIDEEMVVAHFIVSDDVERSRRFYTERARRTRIARSAALRRR